MERALAHAFFRPGVQEIVANTRQSCEATSTRLLQLRMRVFTLISNLRQAVAQPDGHGEAAYLLRILLVSLANYFSELDNALQEECYANASARRRTQKHVLLDIKELIDRSGESGKIVLPEELAHAADAFLVHETALRARAHHAMHESVSLTYANAY